MPNEDSQSTDETLQNKILLLNFLHKQYCRLDVVTALLCMDFKLCVYVIHHLVYMLDCVPDVILCLTGL